MSSGTTSSYYIEISETFKQRIALSLLILTQIPDDALEEVSQTLREVVEFYEYVAEAPSNYLPTVITSEVQTLSTYTRPEFPIILDEDEGE